MLRFYPGYTKANVRDWVARARQKGYLTSLTYEVRELTVAACRRSDLRGKLPARWPYSG